MSYRLLVLPPLDTMRPDLLAKSRDLIVPILGAAKFEQLTAKIFALETVKNIVELRPLLQRS